MWPYCAGFVYLGVCVYSSTTYEEHLTEERKSTKTPDQRELDLVLQKRDVLPAKKS